jgi:hypothetical protein
VLNPGNVHTIGESLKGFLGYLGRRIRGTGSSEIQDATNRCDKHITPLASGDHVVVIAHIG